MRKFRLISIILLTFFACKKDTYNPIPNIHFSDTINLDLPQYNHTSFIVLRGQNGQIFGHQGVVVLKLSNYDIYAFDLMCPHKHNAPGYYFTKLKNNGDIEVICPECDSHFNLAASGSPTEGPAQHQLKQYQTSLNGSILTIRN